MAVRGKFPSQRRDPPPEGRGGNSEVDFRGKRRCNETHPTTTDPEAKLARKGPGKEARLCFGAHGLMDNREGLVVDVRLTLADGAGEWEAALEMLGSVPGARRITVGADRGHRTRGFLQGCRQLLVTPHVAQKQRSALDWRAIRHEGIALASGLGKGLRRSTAG